jgi:hypothetical protein
LKNVENLNDAKRWLAGISEYGICAKKNVKWNLTLFYVMFILILSDLLNRAKKVFGTTKFGAWLNRSDSLKFVLLKKL